MGVYAVRYPSKYIELSLPQVYMLGHWNRLHLLVLRVVSPDHAKNLTTVQAKPLDDTDLDVGQANLILH
jgi:hypothetical protein